jgi:hypothetical protein
MKEIRTTNEKEINQVNRINLTHIHYLKFFFLLSNVENKEQTPFDSVLNKYK